MKVTFTIDEEELKKRVVDIVITRAVESMEEQLFSDNRYSAMRKKYKEDVQAKVRDLIKAHEDEIIGKAVSEAGAIMARKALPKMLESVMGAEE